MIKGQSGKGTLTFEDMYQLKEEVKILMRSETKKQLKTKKVGFDDEAQWLENRLAWILGAKEAQWITKGK